MSTVERTWQLTDDELAALRCPRSDLLVEQPDGADAWTMAEGPFDRYRRTLEVGRADGSGVRTVVERTEYKVAVPFWWPYLAWPLRRALADRNREPRGRWWWPREVVAADTARLISLVATIAAMAGYMGVLIGQTITFAARDFGVDDSVQANTLAGVRVGVLVSMVLITRADRIGRRPLLIWFTFGAIVFSALGAAAPSMVALGGAQTIARGLTTGLLTLTALAATEEVPARSRAMAIAVMYVTTGFGAALVLWVLPLADVAPGGWRILYLVPLLFLPALWRVARRLPETRRFEAAAASQAPGAINWGRFILVGFTALVAAMFASPASQLRNEFLSGDLGFTAAQISVFQLLVSIPATLAVPVGGHLADRFSRRWIGAGGLIVSSLAAAASYQLSGLWLWITASIGFTVAAGTVPALRGYQVELFPTRARARVGGMIDTLAVTGSAIGLVTVGWLSVRWDDLGAAIGVMVFAPLAVAVVIFVFFPETARVELEELNPTDPSLDASAR